MEFIPTVLRMVGFEDAGNMQDLKVFCGKEGKHGRNQFFFAPNFNFSSLAV